MYIAWKTLLKYIQKVSRYRRSVIRDYHLSVHFPAGENQSKKTPPTPSIFKGIKGMLTLFIDLVFVVISRTFRGH